MWLLNVQIVLKAAFYFSRNVSAVQKLCFKRNYTFHTFRNYIY